MKASKFILNRVSEGVEVTSLGSWFQRGTTLFEKKWCLMVVALQLAFLSLALKLSLSRLFLPLRLAAGPFTPRYGVFFGMQCSLISSSPFISLYACIKSHLFLLSSSVVSPTAASLSLYPHSFRSSWGILRTLSYTFSSALMSLRIKGFHTLTAYSK